MAEKSIPEDAVIALVDGLLMDQHPVRVDDEAGLVRYCYHVAGTVGLMMCHILDARSSDAYAFAIDLGIAMQLTNISRDVLEDARMGRRYLPAAWVGDITPDEIVAAAAGHNDRVRAQVTTGVARALNLAEQYYASGIRGSTICLCGRIWPFWWPHASIARSASNSAPVTMPGIRGVLSRQC